MAKKGVKTIRYDDITDRLNTIKLELIDKDEINNKLVEIHKNHDYILNYSDVVVYVYQRINFFKSNDLIMDLVENEIGNSCLFNDTALLEKYYTKSKELVERLIEIIDTRQMLELHNFRDCYPLLVKFKDEAIVDHIRIKTITLIEFIVSNVDKIDSKLNRTDIKNYGMDAFNYISLFADIVEVVLSNDIFKLRETYDLGHVKQKIIAKNNELIKYHGYSHSIDYKGMVDVPRFHKLLDELKYFNVYSKEHILMNKYDSLFKNGNKYCLETILEKANVGSIVDIFHKDLSTQLVGREFKYSNIDKLKNTLFLQINMLLVMFGREDIAKIIDVIIEKQIEKINKNEYDKTYIGLKRDLFDVINTYGNSEFDDWPDFKKHQFRYQEISLLIFLCTNIEKMLREFINDEKQSFDLSDMLRTKNGNGSKFDNALIKNKILSENEVKIFEYILLKTQDDKKGLDIRNNFLHGKYFQIRQFPSNSMTVIYLWMYLVNRLYRFTIGKN